MSRLTWHGTAEPDSRDQILRHVRGQGDINFPCSADDEQDWQPYPVDPYSAVCDDHTSIIRIHYYLQTRTTYALILNSSITKSVFNNSRHFQHAHLILTVGLEKRGAH